MGQNKVLQMIYKLWYKFNISLSGASLEHASLLRWPEVQLPSTCLACDFQKEWQNQPYL